MARWRRSAGIWVATGLLFALSAIFQPKSLGGSALASLWPFAAVLILAAVGQTLVVQQRGIDLSVPGFISLTVVLVTHIPNGNGSKVVGAIGLAYAICLAAGLVNGLLVTRVGITPIVQTLGMNAGLLGHRYQISAYLGAALLYCTAGVLLAGIVSQPDPFQGNNYLLPSVAAV